MKVTRTELMKEMPVPSNVRMGEMSTIGLRVSDGHIFEEPMAAFRWPDLIDTVKRMQSDETIYSANNAIKSLIKRIKWKVTTPDVAKPTPQQVQQQEFIRECMHDMSHSWSDFVNESLSMLLYGFSIHEKVYKTRTGSLGTYKSKFNDGKIGWAKMPIRSQDTIYRWIFDDKFQKLLAVEQNLSYTVGYSSITNKSAKSQIQIPMKKLLHFRHDTQRGNPEGSTPLKACYASWKYKTSIAEFEAIGVSRDMNGMPMISLPPEYMSEDASADKKAVYSYCQDIIRNIHMNEQAGLVFPRFIDPETKADLFKFELVSVDGSKQFDTDKIINRYENKILMTYLADVLKMGQESTGSFALSDNKSNLLAVGIEAILHEFLEVINRDLIPQTALMNGWDLTHLPEITYEDLEEVDLNAFGSFIQKCVSVGAVEVDKEMSNRLRSLIDLPPAEESKALSDKLIGGGTSDAGKGLKTAGEGQSTKVSGRDATSSNASNNS